MDTHKAELKQTHTCTEYLRLCVFFCLSSAFTCYKYHFVLLLLPQQPSPPAPSSLPSSPAFVLSFYLAGCLALFVYLLLFFLLVLGWHNLNTIHHCSVSVFQQRHSGVPVDSHYTMRCLQLKNRLKSVLHIFDGFSKKKKRWQMIRRAKVTKFYRKMTWSKRELKGNRDKMRTFGMGAYNTVWSENQILHSASALQQWRFFAHCRAQDSRYLYT